MKMKCNCYSLRFGPYFCQPVIAGLGNDDKPFICTMDFIGAKYVTFSQIFYLLKLQYPMYGTYNLQVLWSIVKVVDH